MAVTTQTELRSVYRAPAARATQKVLDHLDVRCRENRRIDTGNRNLWSQ